MPDSVYILCVTLGVAIIALAVAYNEWERRIEYRRLERRAHLNLQRMSGEWSA